MRAVFGIGVAMMLAAPAAQAHGALAFGMPKDIAASGVAVGYTANSPTPERAAERALVRCRDEKNAPEDVRALCKV